MALFYRRPRQDALAAPSDLGRAKEDGGTAVADQQVTLRERFRHFTWAWFTFPMSTGGIALLLAEQPHKFHGLMTIGKLFYVFDIVVFVALVASITTRFVTTPGSLQKSLIHPTESLFFPTAWLALVNILGGIQLYGVPSCGPWLVVALRVLFWMYVAATFVVAVLQYLLLFTGSRGNLTIQSMTPSWVLPVFPVMLSGTLASLISPDQPPGQRLPILVAGITMQGLGWMVSFLMYSVYIHRLMQFGLPAPNLRPGMFIAVGPPSFTGLALIGISNNLPPDYGIFAARPMAIEILQTVAIFAAIFLWTLSFWFFCITVISVLAGIRGMTFHLVWWAFVFPNVGFTIATIQIGNQLDSPGIKWLASVMTCLLVAMWFFVLYSHARAFLEKDIMMPGKDEDKDEYKEDDKKHNIQTPP